MSEWISANESLPNPFDEVICFSPSEGVFTGAYHRLSYATQKPDFYRTSSGQNNSIDDFYGDGDLGVTHWMPLPNPPEFEK